MKLPKSVLIKNQTKTFTKKSIKLNRVETVDIIATVRYDDQCSNGHNSFSITGEMYRAGLRGDRNLISCGCIHDDIAPHFPELAPLIKWHLTSSDGPMHYIENTMYNVRDTNYDGLRKGEYSAFTLEVVTDKAVNDESITLYSSDTVYANKQKNPNFTKIDKRECKAAAKFLASVDPSLEPRMIETPQEWSKSEGKESDLQAARNSAVWPKAELEDFTKEALEARLPSLMEAFRRDVESLGFTY